MGSTPYYSQSQVVCKYQILGLLLHEFFCLANIPFLAFYENKNKPYGRSFTPIFTKLAVYYSKVTPSTPENLSPIGQSIWEEIANIHTDRKTDRQIVNYNQID